MSCGSIGRYGTSQRNDSTGTPGHAGVGGHRLEALVDRVLVRAGERGEDKVAAVGVALGHLQLVAVLDRAADLVDVAEVDLRVDALAEQVHAQRHQADVAGALAVAEQAALDPVRAGHEAQLGGGHGRAAVVVRVQAQDDVVAVAQVAVHPLDRVGVDVRRGHLDGRGQVDDDLALGRGLPHVVDRVADLDGELQLGARVGLGGVLVVDVGVGGDLLGVLQAQLRAVHGDVLDPVPVQAEDHPALQRGGRVVQVDDRLLGAADRLVGALDQVLAGLGQHLDDDVVGDQVLLDQLADEVEVRLAGRGEPDLDLLVAHPDQQLEHAPLAVRGHRVDQRLVAVAQVDCAPAGGGCDGGGGPRAVRQVDRRERCVALPGHR